MIEKRTKFISINRRSLSFLADRTNGRAIGTVLRLPSSSVT